MRELKKFISIYLARGKIEACFIVKFICLLIYWPSSPKEVFLYNYNSNFKTPILLQIFLESTQRIKISELTDKLTLHPTCIWKNSTKININIKN